MDTRFIDPQMCPRCGGRNTERMGCDGTPTESRICFDCEKEDGEFCCYDVVRSEQISTVNWTTPDDDVHTVSDSDWLAREAAQSLLEALDQLEKTASKINAMQHAGNPIPSEEWSALYSDCAYAKAVVARAKGERT